jgi:serine/threonine protein kinase
MSPEYYGNNGYQSEVDIWGFGMCVIEMATLSIPFAELGSSVNAIKEAVGNVWFAFFPLFSYFTHA